MAGMAIGFIVCMGAGVLCVVLGLIVWKKQKISLVHDYHTKRVRKEDIPAYTRLIGIGLLIIGIGSSVTAVINLALRTSAGWIVFCIGFAAGILLMNKAQKKYNGSWF